MKLEEIFCVEQIYSDMVSEFESLKEVILDNIESFVGDYEEYFRWDRVDDNYKPELESLRNGTDTNGNSLTQQDLKDFMETYWRRGWVEAIEKRKVSFSDFTEAAILYKALESMKSISDLADGYFE